MVGTIHVLGTTVTSDLSSRNEAQLPIVCENQFCVKIFTTLRSYQSVLPIWSKPRAPVDSNRKHFRAAHRKRHLCEAKDCKASAFGLRADMRRHYKDVHLKEKSWVCRYAACDRSFSRKHNLARHVKKVHAVEP